MIGSASTAVGSVNVSFGGRFLNGLVSLSGTATTTITPASLTFTTFEVIVGGQGNVGGLSTTYTLAADSTIQFIDYQVNGSGDVRRTMNSADTASPSHGKYMAAPLTTNPGMGAGETFGPGLVPPNGMSFSSATTTDTVLTFTIGRKP